MTTEFSLASSPALSVSSVPSSGDQRRAFESSYVGSPLIVRLTPDLKEKLVGYFTYLYLHDPNGFEAGRDELRTSIREVGAAAFGVHGIRPVQPGRKTKSKPKTATTAVSLMVDMVDMGHNPTRTQHCRDVLVSLCCERVVAGSSQSVTRITAHRGLSLPQRQTLSHVRTLLGLSPIVDGHDLPVFKR
jgi:hypothetical protein